MEPDEPGPQKPDLAHVKWYRPPEQSAPETRADEAASYGALIFLFGLAAGVVALAGPYILAFILGGGASRHYTQNHGYQWMEWFAEHDGKAFAILRLIVGAGVGALLGILALWFARQHKDD